MFVLVRALERVTGIEPTVKLREADVLPLNYTRGASQYASRSIAGRQTHHPPLTRRRPGPTAYR